MILWTVVRNLERSMGMRAETYSGSRHWNFYIEEAFVLTTVSGKFDLNIYVGTI
jgi:hypothetical protein